MWKAKDVVEMIITIRIIKSFEFRTFKNIILNLDELMTVQDLKLMLLSKLPRGFNGKYDTLKMYFKGHGSKTSNLIINLDNDDILDDSKTLKDCGIENETEISFFNLEDYMKYKENPVVKW